MSSNAERAPKAGAQVKGEEAVVDFLLRQIGKRASSPTQAVKVCQTLGLANRESIRKVREIAKNKSASDLVGRSQLQLAKAEAENKNQEGQEMQTIWGESHNEKKMEERRARLSRWLENRFQKEIAKRNLKLQTQILHSYYRYVYVFSGKKSDESDSLVRAPEGSVIMTNYSGQIKGAWLALDINVYDKTYLNLARSVGRAYEKMGRTQVFIKKQY